MIARTHPLVSGALTLSLVAAPLAAVGAQPMPASPPTGGATAPAGKPSGPADVPGSYHYDAPAQSDEEPVVIHTGPTPELHVVRRGDTLWDICWYYFNDPWQWPKVWSYNGQITNPHWIYPGDLVRLLPKGFIVAVPVVDPELEPDAAPPPTPAVVDDVVVPGAQVEARLKQVAFVDQEDLDASMIVTGAVEDKELLAEGDDVFVSYADDKVPAIGSRFSVYAEDEQVNHPTKKSKVGSYVRVLGEVQILSVKKDKQARARIISSNGEIERGARVGPLQRQYKAVAPVANEVDVQGTIVARLSRSELIGSGEIVFLDLGADTGVKAGNRLYVVRRGDALPGVNPVDLIGQDDRRFPARALGQVILIEVGKTLSVGLVNLAVEEMGVGDIVMMRKQ